MRCDEPATGCSSSGSHVASSCPDRLCLPLSEVLSLLQLRRLKLSLSETLKHAVQMRHLNHLHAAKMQGAAVVQSLLYAKLHFPLLGGVSSFSTAYAMQLQEAMVEVYWGEDVTRLAPCKTQVTPSGQLVFLG